jgi:hypothetical protein
MTSVLVLAWRPIHPHPSWTDAETDPVLWIDLMRFEAEWRKTDQWVGPGGVPGGLGSRYPRAGEWLQSGRPIDMCQIWINTDGIGFTDGRHRFAWLRDHGLSAMPVQLSPESMAHGVKVIATDSRASILNLDIGEATATTVEPHGGPHA